MLLSLFISFLLVRMSRRRLYLVITATGLLLISFFSVGVPEYVYVPKDFDQPISTEGVLLHYFLPLSFPFYSSVYYQPPLAFRDSYWEEYRLNFLTMILYGTRILGGSTAPTPGGGFILRFSWRDYILYFSVFLLVNTLGAVLGYWISKKRWHAAGILMGIIILPPLILIFNPISPLWNPPKPEVAIAQGYWSDNVFIIDTTIKNNGGAGLIKIYVRISGSGTPMSGMELRSIYFSRGESKTLKYTFETFHPPVTYRVWTAIG